MTNTDTCYDMRLCGSLHYIYIYYEKILFDIYAHLLFYIREPCVIGFNIIYLMDLICFMDINVLMIYSSYLYV